MSEETPDAPRHNDPVTEIPHTNPTPDLNDEQYMEQMFLIAQAIAVMPGQRDGMPNVTTPPPIRARWAGFLLSLGMRIHPEAATHRLVKDAPAAAGNFGPSRRVAMTNQRQSLNRQDLFDIWKSSNPATYNAVMSGEMSRSELGALMPEEMQAALSKIEHLRDFEKTSGDTS